MKREKTSSAGWRRVRIVFICGDAKRMAPDVERALVDVIVRQGGRNEGDAKAYVAGLAKSGRYHKDVY